MPIEFNKGLAAGTVLAVLGLMMIISYGNPRFRVPIEPGLVIAAAVAIVALVDRRRREPDVRRADTVEADAAAR